MWGWRGGLRGASVLSWDLILAFNWAWRWKRWFPCQSRGAREAHIPQWACSQSPMALALHMYDRTVPMYSDLRFPYLIHSCKVTVKFKPSVRYLGTLAALRTSVQMQAPSLPLQSRGLRSQEQWNRLEAVMEPGGEVGWEAPCVIPVCPQSSAVIHELNSLSLPFTLQN